MKDAEVALEFLKNMRRYMEIYSEYISGVEAADDNSMEDLKVLSGQQTAAKIIRDFCSLGVKQLENSSA